MLWGIEKIINTAANTIAAPNWADIWSLVISFLAILVAASVAIYIAQKQNKITERQTEIAQKQTEIAEQQNRIALFEKRFLVFSEISQVINIGQAISTFPKTTLKWLLDTELASLGCDSAIDTGDPRKTILNLVVINRTIPSIRQAVFLFPKIEKEDVNKLCDKFFRFFTELIIELQTNPDATIEQFTCTKKSEFIAECQDFKQKYSSYMVECLRL